MKRELGNYAAHLQVSGCDIVINARAAHQFALIVHELTTNAVKYGALSEPAGRIAITGTVEQVNGASLFLFRWKESEGPPVSKPSRKGFGSVILIDAAQQFGERVTVNYDPQGLSYELAVPLNEIVASQASKSHDLGQARSLEKSMAIT